MDVMHKRVAGLDVHKATVVACVRRMAGRKARRECRTFATTTAELVALRAWLTTNGVTHVAMEATGVFWMPIWKILDEGDFELVLANPAQVKQVPGRKTDVNDATWLADLMACGLIRASFVQNERLHDLRALTRTRKQLVREQTSHVLRLHKTLTEANIRLGSVLSDLMGATGRSMLEAMAGGETDPAVLTALAKRRLKATPEELRAALDGRLTGHHRFLLKLHLTQWDALDAAIRQIDEEIETRIAGIDQEAGSDRPSFRQLIGLLVTIPGVSRLAAITILAEIGLDMSRFETAGHLVSWTGLCPGQNESAGKRKATRLRKGNVWLKTMLVQCAWAAKRSKTSYYRAQFFHLQAKRGPQKAICAVAASILTAVYHIVKNGVVHQDLGTDHFHRSSPQRRVDRLITQLAKLGYHVELTPTAKAA